MEAIRSKIVWTQVLAIVIWRNIIDVHLVTVLEEVAIHILHSVNYLYPVLRTAIWHFTKFIIFLRHKSSGMWHQVNQWAVPDIFREHSVFTFRVKQWLLDLDDEKSTHYERSRPGGPESCHMAACKEPFFALDMFLCLVISHYGISNSARRQTTTNRQCRVLHTSTSLKKKCVSARLNTISSILNPNCTTEWVSWEGEQILSILNKLTGEQILNRFFVRKETRANTHSFRTNSGEWSRLRSNSTKTCKAVIPDTNCINTISTARHETVSMETILVHSCAKTPWGWLCCVHVVL